MSRCWCVIHSLQMGAESEGSAQSGQGGPVGRDGAGRQRVKGRGEGNALLGDVGVAGT